MYKNVTGIILSGGRSKRMGQNKALLKIGNVTLIEKTVELMKSLFTDTILITNSPEEYSFLNIPIFADIYKDKGPLAGIHSGLYHSNNDINLIISCDMPFISEEAVKYLINYPTEKEVVIYKTDNRLQQMLTRYNKSVLQKTEKLLCGEALEIMKNRNKFSLYNLLDNVSVEIIDVEKLNFYNEKLFFNVNLPEEYKTILDMNDEDKQKYI